MTLACKNDFLCLILFFRFFNFAFFLGQNSTNVSFEIEERLFETKERLLESGIGYSKSGNHFFEALRKLIVR